MSKTFTVKLPDIGEGVAEGEIIEWLKKPGEPAQQDEPVVIVMTDKATVELPSPHPGIVAKHYYNPGEKAPVGKPLYDLLLDATTEQTVPLALPKTRHLAKELGIPLSQATPTGKHGEITENDLKISNDTSQPIIGIQNLMAKKMTESHQNIPHFSYFEQTDVTRLIQLKQNIQKAAANEGLNITYMPLFIRALSLTINKYPIINSSIDTNKNAIIIHQQHNIGIATSTPHGLIVPVLKNVQNMKLEEIIRNYNTLKKKNYSPNDMKDATITISNYGTLDTNGRWATPIINFPEVAILALARIQKQPIIKNDTITIRDTINLSWSFDHRIIDGDLASKASHYFATLLSNPAPLL